MVEVEEGPPQRPRYGADTGPQSLERQLRNDGGDDWLVAPSSPFTHHTAEESAQIDVRLVSTSGVVPLARSLLSWLERHADQVRLTAHLSGRTETVEITAGSPEELATALLQLLARTPPEKSDPGGDAGARPAGPRPFPDDLRVGDTSARPGSGPMAGRSRPAGEGPLGVTPPGPPFGDDDEDE
ncbi:hypothetical protein [Actinacidiphila alni]|uniref:hypothetical protein n=1 Tax=Actinacidiphila alni TaxID=380248 RepID=UPI00345202FC